MVLDAECMLSDPVSMVARFEKEREETTRQRHAVIDREFDRYEERLNQPAAKKKSHKRKVDQPPLREVRDVCIVEDCDDETDTSGVGGSQDTDGHAGDDCGVGHASNASKNRDEVEVVGVHEGLAARGRQRGGTPSGSGRRPGGESSGGWGSRAAKAKHREDSAGGQSRPSTGKIRAAKAKHREDPHPAAEREPDPQRKAAKTAAGGAGRGKARSEEAGPGGAGGGGGGHSGAEDQRRRGRGSGHPKQKDQQAFGPERLRQYRREVYALFSRVDVHFRPKRRKPSKVQPKKQPEVSYFDVD